MFFEKERAAWALVKEERNATQENVSRTVVGGELSLVVVKGHELVCSTVLVLEGSEKGHSIASGRR